MYAMPHGKVSSPNTNVMMKNTADAMFMSSTCRRWSPPTGIEVIHFELQISKRKRKFWFWWWWV